MKYLMFVCTDPDPDPEPDPGTGDLPGTDAWAAAHDAAGRRLTGVALAPETTATTVRVREAGCWCRTVRSRRPRR